jgi:hypothetical protein
VSMEGTNPYFTCCKLDSLCRVLYLVNDPITIFGVQKIFPSEGF